MLPVVLINSSRRIATQHTRTGNYCGQFNDHIYALASRGRFWRAVKIGFSKWKSSALSGTRLSDRCLTARRLRSARSGKDPHLPYRARYRRWPGIRPARSNVLITLPPARASAVRRRSSAGTSRGSAPVLHSLCLGGGRFTVMVIRPLTYRDADQRTC